MMDTIDDLYDKLGGMGKFQWVNTLIISLCQIPVGWSMMELSFDGTIPAFDCIVNDLKYVGDDSGHVDTRIGQHQDIGLNRTGTLQHYSNKTLNTCSINGTSCNSYVFEGSMITAVTEWGLVCDMVWAKKIFISIQMAGVLVGSVLGGQLGDSFGRKKVLYSFTFFLMILNIVCGFSVNWIMFACMRFPIGVGIGASAVIDCPYKMEFMPIKLRPISSVLPVFSMGYILLSIVAACLENWSHLHFCCAVVSLIACLGIFVAHESPRWLAVQGRVREAENVIKEIAKMNKTQVPENTLRVLQSLQTTTTKTDDVIRKKYTYIDLFQTISTAKISLFFFYFWFILSVAYYGIAFGVGSLSGNLYLNMSLPGLMGSPLQVVTFFLINRIGRRYTTLVYSMLCFLSLLGCLLSNEFSFGESKGIAICVLSLFAKMMVGSAWATVHLWSTESFPTVTRNLGCGFCSMGARIGGVLAPFMIDLDSSMTQSYGLLCGLLALAILLQFIVPETRGKNLKDSINPYGRGHVSEERSMNGDTEIMTMHEGKPGIRPEETFNSDVEDSQEKDFSLSQC